MQKELNKCFDVYFPIFASLNVPDANAIKALYVASVMDA